MVKRVESLRFDVDPAASGLWDQVRGKVKVRTLESATNGDLLKLVARIYLDIERTDPASITRALERIALEDKGYRV